MHKLKILHLEISDSDIESIHKVLQKSKLVYDRLLVKSDVKLIEALTTFSPDVLLADHLLLSPNILAALLRRQQTAKKIPFLIVSQEISDALADDLISKGVDDYILKDRLGRLPFAIHSAIEKCRVHRTNRELLTALTKSDRRFKALIENSADAVIILNAQGEPTYVSPSVKNVLGYSSEEITRCDILTLAHPDDLPALAETMRQILAKPGVAIQGHTGRMLHKDGNWRWVEATITNLLHDPEINGIVDNFRDITQRVLADRKIKDLNRLYAFQSQINKTIVHVGDQQSLFGEACRIAIEVGNFKIAWVGMIDRDEQRIDLVEGLGVPLQDCEKFKKAPYEDYSPQNQVLKSGTYYVCNDIENDFPTKNWKCLAEDQGCGSGIVLPLRISGRIIGTFNLYASEKGFFTRDEISLLEEAANDLSFSLEILENQKLKIFSDAALRHKEFRLSQAQAIAHLGSWELDLASGIGIWSDEACRIYGLPTTDNIHSYESWKSFIFPGDLDDILKTEKIEGMSAPKACTYRIIRKDGSIRELFAQIQIEFDQAGKPVTKYGVMHDITEIKKAQEELLVSQSNLTAIFDSASEAFILTDTDGRVISFNKKSKDYILFNKEMEIHEGDSILTFIQDARRQMYVDAFAKVVSGETVRYEYPLERNDKNICWFHFTINPVYAGNVVVGFSITIADITERKQSEESLQRSESNLAAIIENTDAFIYSLDTDFRYITFNSALSRMMKSQYGIEIAPGYPVFDFIRQFEPEREQEWHDMYSKALAGQAVHFEKEFAVDGAFIYTSFSIHPMWKDNAVIGLSCFVNDITKEKLANDISRFKANLLNSITQAAISTDVNGIVNYWNKAARQIYGWTEKEAMGKKIIDLIPSQLDRFQSVEKINALEKGQSWSAELITQRKNGTYFPALITNTPVYDDQQKLSGIIAISSDMTERKAIDWLLNKATLMAKIGSYEIDLENDLMYWSSMTREILEVGTDFTVTTKAASYFFKDGPSRKLITEEYFKAIEKCTSFDLELQIVTALNNECWVRITGEAEHINGKCTRLYGSVQDIDKIKKAELDIIKAYKEKNTILESIGDAFFAVDKNWIVTYWNKEAESLLRTPKQQILGKSLWEHFPDAINSSFHSHYQHAVDNDITQNFEAYYEALDIWFDVTAYPSGNGLSVYFRNITERKISENKLHDLNSDLRNYTQELVLSKKGLEQFSYIVSHNLRAPVANVIGLANLLEQECYPSDVKDEFVDGILMNIKRLDNVITDLNKILQVKSDVSEKKEPVDLQELLEDLQSSIDTLILQEGVHIRCNFGAAPTLITIKSYLYSIFYNLIVNSIKYRQADLAPVVTIKSWIDDDKTMISISDNGMGIDLKRRGDQVFGLYKRFHHHVDGKGMGLFMVKTQVEIIGGTISINSEINKGTEFLIEIKTGAQYKFE